MTLTVVGVESKYSLSDKTDFLEVTITLSDGVEEETRVLGFKSDISKKELKIELEKYKETYFAEKESAKKDVIHTEKLKKTEKLIEETVGIVI